MNKRESPSPKDVLCQVEISPFDSGEEDKNVKSLQTDRWTNDKQSEKLPWAFSSGELKTCITEICKGNRTLISQISQACKNISQHQIKMLYTIWAENAQNMTMQNSPD